MATHETDTKLMTCFVKKTDMRVEITPTISHPTSGGWAVFLAGTFVKGGNEAEPVKLGTGVAVIGKMAEVSATMKNITNGTAKMSLKVDGPGDSDKIANDIAAGHPAHYSIFVAFQEEPS